MKDLEEQAEAVLSGARRALTPSARSRHDVRVALAASVGAGAFAAKTGGASAAQALVGNGGVMDGATGGAPGVPSGGEALAGPGGSAAPGAAAGAGAGAAKGALLTTQGVLVTSIVKTVAVIGAVGGITVGVAWMNQEPSQRATVATEQAESPELGTRHAPNTPANKPGAARAGEAPSLDPLPAEPFRDPVTKSREVAPPSPPLSAEQRAVASQKDAEDDVLREEITLLKRAQRAQHSQPTLALALLAELDARFGRGRMWQEREVTRVLALCAAGRTADARRTARQFLNGNPNTLYVERLAKSCASDVDARGATPANKPPMAKFGDAGD